MGRASHTPMCAESIATPRDDCRCTTCATSLHGAPHSDRVTALFEERSDRVERAGRVVKKFKKRMRTNSTPVPTPGPAATDYLMSKVALWMLEQDVDSADAAVVKVAFEDLTTAMNSMLVNSVLDTSQRSIVAKLLNGSHMLCDLCVGLLIAHEQLAAAGEELARSLASAAVAELKTSPVPGLPLLEDEIEVVLEAILVAGSRALFTGPLTPENVLALQLIGMIVCPDWDTHDENQVVEYCLKPYGVAALTGAEIEFVERRALTF